MTNPAARAERSASRKLTRRPSGDDDDDDEAAYIGSSSRIVNVESTKQQALQDSSRACRGKLIHGVKRYSILESLDASQLYVGT